MAACSAEVDGVLRRGLVEVVPGGPSPVVELGLVEAVADDPLAVLLLGGLGGEGFDDLVHGGYRGGGAVDGVAPHAPPDAVLVTVDESGEDGLPLEVYDLGLAPG